MVVTGPNGWAPSRQFLLYTSLRTISATTFDVDKVEWANVQQQLKAYLHLYMLSLSGVYSQISDKFAYLTIKDRWEQLKWLYSGATSSTTVFNNWIMLT